MIEKLNTLMTILSALGLLRDGVKNYIDVSVENSLSNGIVDKLKDSYDNYTAILNKYAIEGKDFDVPSINRDYVIRKLRLIKTIVNRLVEYYINEPETLVHRRLNKLKRCSFLLRQHNSKKDLGYSILLAMEQS
jgi:hypothetical protein